MAFRYFVSELRIVLLGNKGVGKSATGNAILGKEAFKETETTECETQRLRVEDRDILLIDTPGIENTSLSKEEWSSEMEMCVALSSPGPHAFLLVIRLGRFTEQEKNTVNWIQEKFGDEALKFTIVLFVGKEEMTNRQFMKFSHDDHILKFTRQFKGGYEVINSKRERNSAQITKLLEKIENVIEKNRGQFYTLQMYQNVLTKTREQTETVNKKPEDETVKQTVNFKKPVGKMQNLPDHTVELQKNQSFDLTSPDKVKNIVTDIKYKFEETERNTDKSEDEITKHLEKTEDVIQKYRGEFYTHHSYENVLTKTREQTETVNKKTEEETVKKNEEKKPEREMPNFTYHKEDLQKKQNIDMTSLDKAIKTVIAIENTFEETEKNRVKPEFPSEFEMKSKKAAASSKDNFLRQVESRKDRERRKWEEEKGAIGGATSDRESDVRIVLLGGAGSGRSSTGNTILGREAFGQDFCNTNTMCKRQDGMLGSKSITVIDTKGIPRDIPAYSEQFEECLSLCSPGPHVFLWVISSPNPLSISFNVFIYSLLLKLAGREFLKHTIILLTQGDLWGSDHDKLLNYSSELRNLVKSCSGVYQIFNNEEEEDHSQVTELMEKIDRVIQKNVGQPYTKEMYQEAQRKREKRETEEKLRRLEMKVNVLAMENRMLSKEIKQAQKNRNEEGGCHIL